MSKSIRLSSMFLDHMFMSIIILGLAKVIELLDLTILNYLDYGLWFILGIFLYVNKDFLGGQSLAKRILSLQIIDEKTGEKASALQCFLRNMFIIIWPIEVVLTWYNPERRLGDMVAKTKVILRKEKQLSVKSKSLKVTLLTILLSLIFSLLVNHLSTFFQ